METLSTSTLAPDKLPTPEKSLDKFKVAICDIDYTLVDFAPAHEAGIKAIAEDMGEEFAGEVANYFDITLVGHRLKSGHDWEERSTFDELTERTKKLHEGFTQTHGHKVWSRETWIIIAAEKLGVSIDRSKVVQLRDAYWDALTVNSKVYADAKEFLDDVRKRNVALVLMTGSDSILKINDDLSVSYDPEFSSNYKRKRIEKLNFNTRGIVIGDPIDKPDPRYFDKLFVEVSGLSNAQRDEILVVGDSQRNDLDVPAGLGYPTLLIDRN